MTWSFLQPRYFYYPWLCGLPSLNPLSCMRVISAVAWSYQKTIQLKTCSWQCEIIGVQTQTANCGVLLEIGGIPLHIWVVKFAIKNFERIFLGSGNKILLEAYKEGGVCWDLSIKSPLEINGMPNFYVDNQVCEYPFVFHFLSNSWNIETRLKYD